jgi:ATP-dependent Clp protease ATP-binding subunit ClpX
LTDQKNNDHLCCSFCGKSVTEVKKLIAGPAVHICDECIRLSQASLSEEMHPAISSDFRILCPRNIKELLDQHIVGQTIAKKIMAVAVYNHYKRRVCRGRPPQVEIQKSNVLLIGPTGCGKTLMAQTLAGFLNVPITIVDATGYTQAGYVGDDVENILLHLLQKAEFDLEKAQRGIVYIDEIDKIARKSVHSSGDRDVAGEGVQQALLKILEGTTARVPPHGGRKHPQQDYIEIDTADILFVCGGTFTGLEKIIQRRIDSRTMGFGSVVPGSHRDPADILNLVQPEDLLEFGMIPEFIGRLPVIAPAHALGEEELMQVLTEPKNALIKQYQKLFEMEGVSLSFAPEALRAMAIRAASRKSGARGLRAILESVLLDTMFELPSLEGVTECVITKDAILRDKPPLLSYRPNKQIA